MFGHRTDVSTYIYIIVEVIVTLQMAVCVATAYGLDDSGIEFRCGRNFQRSSRPASESHTTFVALGTGVFLGGKTVGAWY